jgi:predicted Zn-dependent protease
MELPVISFEESHMRYGQLALGLVISVLVNTVAVAAGGSGGGGGAEETAAQDPQYTQALAMIRAHEYAKAIPVLNAYAARSPADADVENYLGYANRKAGNLPAAFTHYKRALTLNPKHRGVHEYIGEAYLMQGNLAKAEEHLKELDGLCTFSCEEYRDLKAAIATYKAKQTAAK